MFLGHGGIGELSFVTSADEFSLARVIDQLSLLKDWLLAYPHPTLLESLHKLFLNPSVLSSLARLSWSAPRWTEEEILRHV